MNIFKVFSDGFKKFCIRQMKITIHNNFVKIFIITVFKCVHKLLSHYSVASRCKQFCWIYLSSVEMVLLKLKLDDVENPNSSVNQSELSSDISEFLSKRERYQTLVEMCHYFYDFPF